MLPKPSGCQGCPFYGDGKGFVPDTIQERAPVVIYAQGPGEDEEAGRRYLGSEQYEAHPPAPLIGRTGRVLDTQFLPLAGLNREDVSLANSIRCRLNHKNHLPPITQVVMQQAVEHCTRAHWRPPEGPGGSRAGLVYVTMGEYAFYTLTGMKHDFNGWRGYLVPKRHPWDPPHLMTDIWTPGASDDKIFVTYHLAYLWKEPEAELPARRDWNKLALILDGTWPRKVDPFIYEPPALWPTYAAFDTEFAREDKAYLTRYSLATRDRKVWVVEREDVRRLTVTPGSTVIMHNAPADIPHLAGVVDIADVVIEDTMYAHAVLWTGKVETDEDKGRGGGAMSHKLNFLGSMYGWINRWKHLAKVNPKRYSGGDGLGTMDVWETGFNGGLLGELTRDPQSHYVYTTLQKPLIPIVVRNQQTGIPVNTEEVKRALAGLVQQQKSHILRAQAYTGWPINLRSPRHLAHWLYDVEGLKVKRRAR